MAQAIIQTYNDNGRLQLDSTAMTWSLMQSYRGSVVSRDTNFGVAGGQFGNTQRSKAMISVPEWYIYPLVVLVINGYKLGFIYRTQDNGNFRFFYASDAPPGHTFEVHVMALTQQSRRLQPGEAGVELYREDGQLTWSSNNRSYNPMSSVLHRQGGGAQRANHGVRTGICQSAYGGHRIKGPLVNYGGSGGGGGPQTGPTPDDGDTGGSGTNYGYDNNGKIYGALIDGTTLVTGPISFDDVQIRNLGSNPQLIPDYNTPATFFAVNLTGFPGV